MRSSGNLKWGRWRKLFIMFKSSLMQSLSIFQIVEKDYNGPAHRLATHFHFQPGALVPVLLTPTKRPVTTGDHAHQALRALSRSPPPHMGEASSSTRDHCWGGVLDPFRLLATMLHLPLTARSPALVLTVAGHDHRSPLSSETRICTASLSALSGTCFQPEPTAIAVGASPSLLAIFFLEHSSLTATVRPPPTTPSSP
jgi:hypothetical protein